MTRGPSRSLTDAVDARLILPMLIALVVSGVIVASIGFDPLSSSSPPVTRLLVVVVTLIGFFEGSGAAYLLLRSLRRRSSESSGNAKSLYVGGFAVALVFGFAAFVNLMLLSDKNILQHFVLGLVFGASVGAASLLRLATKM